MSAAKVIDRLSRVKSTGPGRWLARCPAHEDRGPSLSIRELDDGRLLLHDFGGCSTEAVLSALGLTLADLFPAGARAHHAAASHSRIPARDLLEVVSEEVTIVSLIAADLRDRRSISEEDWKRLATAAARIGKATDHVR